MHRSRRIGARVCLLLPLDRGALVVYSRGMGTNAAHEHNATRKAERAVETIEGPLLATYRETVAGFETETATLHGWLSFTHGALFGAEADRNPQLAAALWVSLGALDALLHGHYKSGVTEFDASERFIDQRLQQRITQTRPQPATNGDPFAGLGFGPGANMDATDL